VTSEIFPNTADLREYFNEYLVHRVMLGEVINFDILSDMVVYVTFESFVQAKNFC